MSCPVCKGNFGKCQRLPSTGDAFKYKCDGCGRFDIAGSAYAVWFGANASHNPMSPLQRSALSHALRIASSGSEPIRITDPWMQEFLRNARLPSPATQAASLIARIGDCVSKEGKGLLIDPATEAALVGAFDVVMFNDLLSELTKRELVKQLEQVNVPLPRGDGHLRTHLIGLTLDGWERYESEKRGRFAGDYGFIAMKFGEPTLEKLVTEVVKPAVHERLGYEVIDMRNVARAGVIDNIMRAHIRDAAFVLVDLTHDNYGAYWEAGYAEGLGKPVIYLCDKSKFDKDGTHFDTNHCTTVMWSSDDPETFVDSLVATLRRSLNPPRGEGYSLTVESP